MKPDTQLIQIMNNSPRDPREFEKLSTKEKARLFFILANKQVNNPSINEGASNDGKNAIVHYTKFEETKKWKQK